MAENREYYLQTLEDGSIQISDEVLASVAAAAVLEVEGVCGLSSSIGTDIAEMLGRKTLTKGIRLLPGEGDSIRIDCDVVAKFGTAVLELAKNVQISVKSAVESITGMTVSQVNVNICAIALPRDGKK